MLKRKPRRDPRESVTLTKGQRGVLKRLRRRARKWGGDIRLVTEATFRSLEGHLTLSYAPFTSWDLGVDYENKIIYFSPYCMPEDTAHFGINIIHELGHAFASPTSPRLMSGSEEPGQGEYEFFGWEMTLALNVGFTLDEFWTVQRDYQVDDGDGQAEIQHLSPDKLEALYQNRISVATHLGLLKNGRPVAIR